MSTRNPFEELERFFERMSRQFDETAHIWEPDVPGFVRQYEPVAIDVVERDDEFVVAVDLPGFEREDVSIKGTDHTLRIKAEHEERFDEERDRFVRHERRHESVDRSIGLPSEVDPETVTAKMKNGVLTVTLPRVAMENERQIDIE
jgi:HSP20 family protein